MNIWLTSFFINKKIINWDLKILFKMAAATLNPIQFPKLSSFNPEVLDPILENLAKTANPKKEQISETDKIHAAQMLEMDLQAQSGSIQEGNTDWEHPHLENNLQMLQKIARNEAQWQDSYP